MFISKYFNKKSEEQLHTDKIQKIKKYRKIVDDFWTFQYYLKVKGNKKYKISQIYSSFVLYSIAIDYNNKKDVAYDLHIWNIIY